MAAKEFNEKQLLEALKRARENDPGFEKAIKEFCDAEARHGKDDPAEGKRVPKKAPKP